MVRYLTGMRIIWLIPSRVFICCRFRYHLSDQDGTSTELELELEFGNVGSWEEGKIVVPGKKTSRIKEENQQ